MGPAKTPRRNGAFGLVSTVLMASHALVAVATLAAGVIVALAMSRAPIHFGYWGQWPAFAAFAIFGLHILLMLATPLWAWLAARTQTRAPRLWAWLGYLIPVAAYWLPARTLREMAGGTSSEAWTLRRLVLIWGIARSLAAPEIMAAGVYSLYVLDHKGNLTAYVAVAYVLLSPFAANLLSMLMIGQMRRHLAITAIDERHAEVFA